MKEDIKRAVLKFDSLRGFACGGVMSWYDLLKTVPLYVAALAAVVWLTVIETDLNESPIVRLQQVSSLAKGQTSY